MNYAVIDIGRSEEATPIQQMYLDALRYVCGLFSYDRDAPEDEKPEFPEWLHDIENRYEYEPNEFHALIDFILEQFTTNSEAIYTMIVAGVAMGDK